MKVLLCWWKDRKEKRDPAFTLPGAEAPYKVAVIGAGWTGLQSSQLLMKYGANVEMFEQFDGVGGTWNPKMSYNDLRLHSPLYTNEFENFPHKDHDERYLERLSAEETRQYMNDFIDFYGFRSRIHCNQKLTEIHHRTNTKDAMITCVDPLTGKSSVHGPFNLVVFASFASCPVFPLISNKESFKGQIMHSSALKPDVFEQLCKSNKKVLVIGANKSGSDCMIMFARAGYTNATWLFRKSYMFIRYEVFSHSKPNHRNIFETIRGLFAAFGLTLSLLSDTAAAVFLQMIGYLEFAVNRHFDFTKFHLGVLDKDQLRILRTVPRVVGTPISYTASGVRLLDSTEVPADVIICATGYSTGLLDILITVDDNKYKMQANSPLFEHLIVPEVPTLALATPALYTFGPRRGAGLAQHVWLYLNTRPSTQTMIRSAKRNFLSESAHVSLVFQSQESFIRTWLLFFLDLIRTGTLPVSNFLRHVIGMFAGSWQSPLQLKKVRKMRR